MDLSTKSVAFDYQQSQHRSRPSAVPEGHSTHNLVFLSSGSCVVRWDPRTGACVSRYLKKPTGKVGNGLLGKKGYSLVPSPGSVPSEKTTLVVHAMPAVFPPCTSRVGVWPFATSPRLYGKIRIEGCKPLSPKGPRVSIFTVWFRGCHNYRRVVAPAQDHSFSNTSLQPA